MVLTEEFADVVELRPGRRVFVRKVVLSAAAAAAKKKHDGPATRAKAATSAADVQLQLVFVHGTCGSQAQFDPLLQSLNEQIMSTSGTVSSSSSSSAPSTPTMMISSISCVLWDSVGCGQSPPPASPAATADSYSNEAIQRDLNRLLQDYAIASLPTVLVGHSYGPSIFLPMMLRQQQEQHDNIPLLPPLPVVVAGCILIGSAVRNPSLPIPDGGVPIMKLLPVWGLQCLQPILTEAFVRCAVHADNHDVQDVVRSACKSNRMAVAKAYHGQMQWAQVGGGGGDGNDTVFSTGQFPPVLVLHGAQDGIVPVENGQHLHNLFHPQSKLVVIDRASHQVMMEMPDEVAQAVVSFLSENLVHSNKKPVLR
jgi:pimeloyl-ACP methyl ester carboxylesterase